MSQLRGQASPSTPNINISPTQSLEIILGPRVIMVLLLVRALHTTVTAAQVTAIRAGRPADGVDGRGSADRRHLERHRGVDDGRLGQRGAGRYLDGDPHALRHRRS